jgi:hypothetical protein
MDAGSIAMLILLALLAGSILLPVYLRNLLYRKALDTVAKALERGIDPERIAVQLPALRSEADSDPNGNWKAGIVISWIGIGFFICVTVPVLIFTPEQEGGQAKWLALVLPVMLWFVGGALLHIHRRIVGRVVRHGERPAVLPEGSAAGPPAAGTELNL